VTLDCLRPQPGCASLMVVGGVGGYITLSFALLMRGGEAAASSQLWYMRA
jgi:hypothetical protein